MNDLVFKPDGRGVGTSFQGYLSRGETDPLPWSFEETVGRLITLSGQDPSKDADHVKVSVEFLGEFDGELFTLYDYRGDRTINIGGYKPLDVDALREALYAALEKVEPTPYEAYVYEERPIVKHRWPPSPTGE